MRALALILALLCAPALAGPWVKPGEWWAVGTVTSYHEHDHGYTNRNFGAGLEYGYSEKTRFVGGGFRNSGRQPTFYLGVQTCWLPVGPVCLSSTTGLVTGYSQTLAVIPSLQLQSGGYGANLFAGRTADTGWVLGLQLKARF